MKVKTFCLPLLLTIFLFVFLAIDSTACSMYKITADGRTMVGCNEDAWRITSRIWFENAELEGEYGAAFTGSRKVSGDRITPQSGMNEVGLVFSRLAAYHPPIEDPFPKRKKIKNEAKYLSEIMHKCATVAEAKAHIEQYDHSFFYDHVFIYIDSSGSYLIVEPYKLIEGNDPYYLLSNFCPSITSNEDARGLERYRKGEDLINSSELSASLDFCRALSDSMHVCRNRNGDGTLLTSIWDTKDGEVELYFYHDYSRSLHFELDQELAKGDHSLNIAELLPGNAEYERLASYITPFNSPRLRLSMVGLGGILSLFALLFFIIGIRNKNPELPITALLPIAILNLLLCAYLAILATNPNIFYFDAPYQDYSSGLITASSYIPFLLLMIILPYSAFSLNRFRSTEGKWTIKSLLLSNNIIYFLLMLSFAYWGLFSIWN